MKSTSTTSEPAYTGSLIWLFGTTTFPSKPNKGESLPVKSSGFKFSPLYKSGYLISASFPWTNNTLFTLYPPILRVTTSASLHGYRVPTLSLSKKLNAGQTSILALFSSRLESSVSGGATNITLEGWELVLPGAARMTLIMPKGGLEDVSFWDLDPAWPLCLLGWCRNFFNFPSLTSCSRWFHKVLQSSVVCPRS